VQLPGYLAVVCLDGCRLGSSGFQWRRERLSRCLYTLTTLWNHTLMLKRCGFITINTTRLMLKSERRCGETSELKGKSAEQILRDIDSVPQDVRTMVRNNGGGHVNHTMFWSIMSPDGGGDPTGAIASAITNTFGSFVAFKQQFNNAERNDSVVAGHGWSALLTASSKSQVHPTKIVP